MKRFPFKRQLIILASIIAALCIAIPVATFAKSASGEPHHPTPTVRHLTTTASGDPAFSITTDADCHVGADTVVSFHKGDAVSGTANLVSTPPDPSEAGENEPLVLGGTNVPTIPGNPFAVDTGSHSFSFTATGDGTLTACVGGSDGGDGDESGTITGTVTTPTPVPTPLPAPVRDCKADHTSPQTCAKHISNTTGNDLANDLIDRFQKFDVGVLCVIAIRQVAIFGPEAMLAVIVYDQNCLDTLQEGFNQGYYLVLCIFNPICRSGLVHNPLAL